MYIYLITINIISFILYGLDKYKAIHNKWRIPEMVLISISFLGGGVGSILGIIIFRHKTKKLKFSVGLPTILISEVALVVYCIIKFL